MYLLEPFRKNIQGIDFDFQGLREGNDEVCRVSVDGQQFKMTVNENGTWHIEQQVPAWVKAMETQLGEAIDEKYSYEN
ncbi:MAG TPA: hypothetical protein VEX63_02410 [Flavisolibacter sp.]|jgi:hypothetical protein|nr:hypothetical protein [Flavisolibacter sp.]